MEEKLFIIEKALDKYLENQYPNEIYESMRYSVFSKSKRLRPLIILSVCEALGGKIDDAIPFACAIEMIHTYSLIHDDLPALDNDDIRRGKATNHLVYGEDMAILAGDGLLNFAYEILFKELETSANINKIKACSVLSSCAGVDGMIGGQVIDVLSEKRDITDDDLKYIYKNKTGKLFVASFVIGGLLAGYKDINKLEKIGENYGLAFQVKDDILDIESTTEVLGKPVGSDEKNNKKTYITLYTMEDAKNFYEKLKGDVTAMSLEVFGCNSTIHNIIVKSFNRKN